MVRRSPIKKGWGALPTYTSLPMPGDPLAALEELGIEVIKVSGDEALAKCPAHLARTGSEDHHPSFSVNLEAGVFSCFSCGFRGPFIFLVELMLNLERDAAFGWVRARGGIEHVRRSLEPTSILPDTSTQINEASLALFVEPPKSALGQRGLSVASARHYGVLWDAKKERWITPIRDPDTGALWGWQAKNARYFRNIPNDVKKSHALFGVEHLQYGVAAILVESPLDVLRIFTCGIDGAVSSYGAGISNTQVKIIMERTEHLIVALDNDKDGTTYSKWLAANYSRRIDMKFFNYSDVGTDVKDPGEMTMQQILHAIDTSIPSPLIRF